MSYVSEAELARLQGLGFEIREAFNERGYRIGLALDQDASFRNGEGSRSALGRALMKEAVGVAAGVFGMTIINGRGGSRSVQSYDDDAVDRRYRHRTREGPSQHQRLIALTPTPSGSPPPATGP